MSVERIYIGADMELPYEGAYADGGYLNSATVTWELFTTAGDSVANGTCDYVTGSDGNYLGVIESTVTAALTAGRRYRLVYTLASGSINDARRIDCVAAYRGSE